MRTSCCYGHGWWGEWPGTGSPLDPVMVSRVIVPPPVEPLTLAEVRLDRAIDNDLQDELLTRAIKSAREYVEGLAGVSLVTQTREVNLTRYTAGDLDLPFGPVQSIVTTTGTGPFVVQYVAGYPPIPGAAPEDPVNYTSNIPSSFKSAMLLLIGTWFENRENTIVGTISSELELGVHALIGWYRHRLGMA